MTRQKTGFIVAGLGVVVVLVASLADVIGISSGGSAESFGTRQIIGTIVGVVILLVGLVVSQMPTKQVAQRVRPRPATRRRKRPHRRGRRR